MVEYWSPKPESFAQGFGSKPFARGGHSTDLGNPLFWGIFPFPNPPVFGPAGAHTHHVSCLKIHRAWGEKLGKMPKYLDCGQFRGLFERKFEIMGWPAREKLWKRQQHGGASELYPSVWTLSASVTTKSAGVLSVIIQQASHDTAPNMPLKRYYTILID